MEMLRKYTFGTCNISQFYPRPGTPAARMKRVDTKIAKRRSREFSKVRRRLYCISTTTYTANSSVRKVTP